MSHHDPAFEAGRRDLMADRPHHGMTLRHTFTDGSAIWTAPGVTVSCYVTDPGTGELVEIRITDVTDETPQEAPNP